MAATALRLTQMSRITLFFLHGWGFDSSVWQKLAGEFQDVRTQFADLGYFGRQCCPRIEGPVVAVGHSLGSLLLLNKPPRDCRALVAINGFDYFAQKPGSPGVDPRLISRMLMRFRSASAEVLAEFRRQCRTGTAPDVANVELLYMHLGLLLDADARERTNRWNGPILSLQADDDPILPAELQSRVFAEGRAVRRVSRADGGHVLPLTQPTWCAAQIRSLLAQL